jgi:hypothetical protein
MLVSFDWASRRDASDPIGSMLAGTTMNVRPNAQRKSSPRKAHDGIAWPGDAILLCFPEYICRLQNA